MKSLILLIPVFLLSNIFGQPLKSLIGDERSVRTVCFSPDGQYLVSGEGNRFNKSGCICAWDVKTWKLLKKTEVDYSAQVSFSPDGNLLGNMSYTEKAFGRFILWDYPAMTTKWMQDFDYDDYDNIVPAFSFSPNNDNIIFLKESVKSKTKIISIISYNFKTNSLTEDTLIREKSGESDMTGYKVVQYSPDGKTIVFNSNKNYVYVWDMVNKRQLFKLKGKDEFTSQAIIISPKNNLVASCNYSDKYWVYLWDMINGQPGKILKGHDDKILSLAFSPDGTLLASCGLDDKVKLWEVESGKLIITMKDHTDDVNGVCFSPDGRYLASASSDESVKIWDVAALISSTPK